MDTQLSIESTIIVSIIIAIALVFPYIKWKTPGKNPSLISLGPGLVITFGILGTFIGIYLAISSFDPANIEEGVPQIIDGMKTAFLTSIAGMLGSVVLKILYSLADDTASAATGNTSDDPMVMISQILQKLSALQTSNENIEKTIVKCFQSEDEASMVSQMKLIRADMADSKRELSSKLDDFGEKVSKLATEGIMEALKEVMNEFNTILGNVVGKSFDDLSASVTKLVEWQENYSKILDDTQKRIEEVINLASISSTTLENTSYSIKAVDESMSGVENSISSITLTVSDIEANIQHLRQQNESLKELMESVKEIGEQSKTVMPVLSNSVNELSKDLKDAQDQYSKNLRDSMDSMVGSFAAVSQKFAEDYSPLADKLREVVRIAENLKVN